MTVYLLPPAIEPDEITALCKKAGVPFEQFSTLREFVLRSADAPVVIATMRAQDLLILNRYADSLVTELPSVVMSAPGVAYTGDWVSLASALPALDWKEVVDKISKTGHTAYTPENLEKRDLGSPAFPTIQRRSLLEEASSAAHKARISDPDIDLDFEGEPT